MHYFYTAGSRLQYPRGSQMRYPGSKQVYMLLERAPPICVVDRPINNANRRSLLTASRPDRCQLNISMKLDGVESWGNNDVWTRRRGISLTKIREARAYIFRC